MFGTAVGQPRQLIGSRIVDVIEEMRGDGIVIIYSSSLLPDTLRVQAEPSGADPIDRLRSLLQPHGLTLRIGPRDSWLVVSDTALPPTDAGPPLEREPPILIGPPTLEDIIVSASRYAFFRATGTSTSRLSRTQIESYPSFGEDALRATHGLPGLTSSGLTARVNVRGGVSDEALVLLDGVKLYNPFHMKDFESLFSAINPRIVESMAVYTGAFPAEFGNKMSAVIDIETVVPNTARLFEVEVSTLTTSLLSSGRFAGDRGTWTTSIRRGNLDVLIDAASSDLGKPQYVDFYSRVSFEINGDWTASVGALVTDDKITLRDADTASASADYDDRYVWLRLDQTSARLQASYLFSDAHLTSERRGTIADPQRSTGGLFDSRRFDNRALRADWDVALSDAHHLRLGAEYASSDSRYMYLAEIVDTLPIRFSDVGPGGFSRDESELSYDGAHSSAYVSYRAQPLQRVTTELGFRWDRQDYIPDSQLSPRLNMLFDLGERASLRGSWGRYHQVQSLDEIPISDGITRVHPAQESEHTVFGFEYLVSSGAQLRLELYRKEFERLNPRHENPFSRVSLLPELLPDRVLVEPTSALARGIEFSAEGERDRWGWWLNFARSDIEDVLTGRDVPRSWHERWSAKGGINWYGDRWNVSIAANFHSGWPRTDLALEGDELVAGPYNSERFGQFDSLDVRASRQVELKRGSLEWFLELNNALDRNNPCCVDYRVVFDPAMSPSELDVETENWLPVIPTFGIRWQFSK